ncbi:hypothetical protein GH714_001055 [Hevea brasiliensis]|uniref:Protein kinase domain-containing protein n=1 Tax=Hevea brasiliensis TaxID=3981 RepID=A0A6A6LUB3_HEVBR|nr:hypothetical protein GH714_001055 [Hevea brasiliensis]
MDGSSLGNSSDDMFLTNYKISKTLGIGSFGKVKLAEHNNIFHRDLKPENLLLDSECNVKIDDFGLSNITEHGQLLKTSCGSPSYAAPEVVSGKPLPFEGDFGDLRRKVKIGKYVLPSNLSPGPRDLISKIIVVDPTKRITIPEIPQHSWFQACIPCYIAASLPYTIPGAGNIDEEILNEVVIMGFERNQLIESL